ncbi:MAG: histidine phosphatase family protein [Rhodobacteraceae bacterium]|nr:histidine phosphatase family protein [Paracoccaceae bacterium]
MKTLLLMRHGKSSWDNPLLADHDRPLADRGEKAAARMGQWLADEGLKPDAVILSSALRVTQTWAGVQKQLGIPLTVRPDRDLYMISAYSLLQTILRQGGTAETLIVVNHEPTLSHLSEMLAKPPVAQECARAFVSFPTAAIARFEFDIKNWSDLRQRQADFSQFVRPKQLA